MRVLRGLILTLAPGLALTAAAQDAAETDVVPVESIAQADTEPLPAADGVTALEVIEVTAERKLSTVQETPISIEVFNAEKLQQRGINGLAGLTANVPSLTIEPFPIQNATLRMFIRGVGTADAQVTQDPAIGVYVDGVYIARSVGLAVDTADLERIEVLRGPQGTLYGRNTTGGAINMVTRRPNPGAFNMAHQFTAGERGLYTAKSSFNIPLDDRFAVKLALLGSEREGFVENTGPGGDYSDRREWAVRLDARWLAADWLTADYSYDQSDLQFYNAQFQGVIPPNTAHGLADQFKPYAQDRTVYSDRRLETLSTVAPLEASGSHVQGHAVTFEMPLEGYALKYIGAYRQLTDDQYIDLGGGSGIEGFRLDTHAYDGPAADAVYGGPTPLSVPQVYQQQVSHELQISGSWFDDTLDYIAGAYYFTESGGEIGTPVHHILNALVEPSALQPVLSNAPELSDLLIGLVSPRLVAFWDYNFSIRNTAKAIFSQLTWSPDFADRRLHLTAGLRKSWDRRQAVKDFVQLQYIEGQVAGGSVQAVAVPPQAFPGVDAFENVRADRSYEDFSPSFNLRYDLARDVTVYATFARAYKSGGYNLRDPQISGASGPASDGENYGFGFMEGFAPEIVESMELGIKSEWLGRRLRVNADFFSSRYKDMQTNFLISGTISDTKSRNVGKARMRGLELETMLVVMPGLYLAGSYSYLDAEVLEVIDVNGDNLAHLYPFVSAPPKSYVASLDWSFAETPWGVLRAYMNYNYIGKRQGTVIDETKRGFTSLFPFGTLNARLSLNGWQIGERGALEIALWGKNLADREYEVFAVDNLPQADRAVLWGEPRALGLDLVYRYF